MKTENDCRPNDADRFTHHPAFHNSPPEWNAGGKCDPMLADADWSGFIPPPVCVVEDLASGQVTEVDDGDRHLLTGCGQRTDAHGRCVHYRNADGEGCE